MALPAAAQTRPTPTPATSAPLQEVPANVRQQPLASAPVTHQAQVQVPAGQAPVTVRSIQPDSVIGDYRIDFDALDSDGDGFISRAEAQANPSLAAEFDALDTARSGRLSREQLAGWLR
ncbi:EF-hand domain-containing protein [Stenotrophomonas sp. MMGLT7]|uniref:EF-hand domain-containing protein n=1 Tax=Stenotrophomonas sp. MMGLT7 TaxID=2901227 RepID=UPI001E314E20|nr:EF-hand domain-containing protein [Stenotrophomonas sp. MMGLT7]MCD7098185.1 EF-hand domain-containing protein [Stenotrophomonas sp. MMGLT7]